MIIHMKYVNKSQKRLLILSMCHMGRKWHGIYANIPEGKKVTVFKIGFHVRIDIQ